MSPSRPGELQDKLVLITGAGSGIGHGIARVAARHGADLVLTDIDVASVERVAAELDGVALRHDVTSWDSCVQVVDRVLEDEGRIDVLVNNAGIGEEVPFLEIDENSWDRVVGTNLRGAFLFAQRVAREQVTAGGGSIVHIASIDASGADGPFASYNASKAGLLGLNRTMAMELARHGIRVNCVSPGFTDTEMTSAAVPPELMDYLVNRFDRVPMRRLVRPEGVK